MAYLNLLCFSVLVLALLLFVSGYRFASKSNNRRALLLGMGIAVASAVPALLFAAYYGHLLDIQSTTSTCGPAGAATPYRLHGNVIVCHYSSRTFGGKRRMHIYTPPGYDPNGVRRYPVLYLLTGSPGDDSNWTTVGAHLMLDAQITAHQCEPCIVVMPDSEFRHKRYGRKGFEHDLFTDIIPLIERTYQVKTDAGSRAIAGLSMGGFYSIEIGLNHLDRFAWIGVFSAGLRKGFVTADNITGLNTDPKQAHSRLKLFYVRIGKQERREEKSKRRNRDFVLVIL
jgi:enterochelin esterase-like enzyme